MIHLLFAEIFLYYGAQKFLYPIVQKISVKSRWINLLITSEQSSLVKVVLIGQIIFKIRCFGIGCLIPRRLLISTGSYSIIHGKNMYLLQITRWYRNDWWNSANIVGSDFFLSNNLIEESIISNRRRQQCRRMARFTW